MEKSIAKFSGNLDNYIEESKDLHDRQRQQLKAAKQRSMTSKYIDKMIKNEKTWIIQRMQDVKDSITENKDRLIQAREGLKYPEIPKQEALDLA